MLVYERGILPSDPMVFFAGIHIELLHSSSVFFNSLIEIPASLPNVELATVSARDPVYNITPGYLWNRVFRMRQDVSKRNEELEGCLNVKFS